MITKRVFKWWWGWNPTAMEMYLERMGETGWQLQKVGFGMIFFKFVRKKEHKVRFALDYHNRPTDEYRTIITDDGWECVAKSAGWLMWKKPYTNTRPELMTDNQSLIDRNDRLLRFLSVMALLQIPVLFRNLAHWNQSENPAMSLSITIVYLPSVILLLIGTMKLYWSNRALKGQGRR